MKAGFVWDDQHLIVDNTLLHSASLSELILSDLWAGSPDPSIRESGYFRPLLLLGFKLDYVLFGLEPLGWHIHSLLWHVSSTLLLYAFLLVLFKRVSAALLGAMFFAVHPAAVETVMFIAARNDAMTFSFMMASFLALGQPKVSIWRLILGGILVFLGCLSKEIAYLSPVFIGALFWLKEEKVYSHPFLVALAATAMALAFRSIMGQNTGGIQILPLSFDMFLDIMSHYASVIFWPFDLAATAHISTHADHFWLLAYLPILLLMKTVKNKNFHLGMLLALIGFLPSMLGVLKTGFMPDRYLYFPLAGFGLILALAVQKMSLKRIAPYSFLLFGSLLWASFQYADKWENNKKLYTHAHEVYHQGPVLSMLAKVLEDEGDYVEAAYLYGDAVIHSRPTNEYACWNVTSAYLKAFEKTGNKKYLKSGIYSGESGIKTWGCDPSIELVAPLLFMRALMGDWDQIEDLVLQNPRDPKGRLVILRVAIGAIKRDIAPFNDAVSANPGGDPKRLLEMSAQVLKFSGDRASASWLEDVGWRRLQSEE